MVRAHAPGARPRRQGPELPQAGPRLVATTRPAPGTTGSRSPSGRRSGPAVDYLFPYYRDLTTCLAAGHHAPRRSSSTACRRRPTSPPAAGTCRTTSPSHRPRRPERLLLRLEPRAARRGPRPGDPDLREQTPSSSARSASRRPPRATSTRPSTALAREAPGRLRHPGQRLRHLGPEERPDGEPLRVRQLRRLPEPQDHPLRRQGRPRLGPRDARGGRVRPEPAPACAIVHADCVRIHSHSNSDRHELYRDARGARRRAGAGPAPPLPPAPPRGRAPSPRRSSARSRQQNERTYEERRRPRPQARPTRTRRRSTTSSSPSPGSPRGRPRDVAATPAAARRRRRPEIDAHPRAQRDAEGAVPREPRHLHLGPGRRLPGEGRHLQRHEGHAAGVREPPGLQRPDRRGLHPRARPTASRASATAIRVVVEGAEFADYFWPAAEQMVEMSHEYWRTNGPVRPERHRAPRLGRLHRRRPLPLAEHRGLAHDAARDPRRRPGLRRRRRRASCARPIRSRGITLYLEPKFLYNSRSAQDERARRTSPCRSARRASAAPGRT